MRLPPLPPSAPPFGNAATRALGRVVLRLAGFRVEGTVPDIGHCVAIAAPHTSNYDLPLSLAAMFALGVRVNWLGKHTIFREPLGTLLRWLGGVPVDRGAATNTVDQAVAALRRAPRMFLGVAPEGTRSRVDRWKTGFHRIAVTAGVPIVPVCLDYSRRVVRIFPAMVPTADAEADIAALQQLYRADMGHHPANYGQ
jgi:1-acyl-sn-glycerol-3-phosphate acyltransferase